MHYEGLLCRGHAQKLCYAARNDVDYKCVFNVELELHHFQIFKSSNFQIPQFSHLQIFTLFFGSHLGEKQHILYRNLPGKQHGQPLYPKANTRSWRHTVFQRPQEIIVYEHRLFITTLHQTVPAALSGH